MSPGQAGEGLRAQQTPKEGTYRSRVTATTTSHCHTCGPPSQNSGDERELQTCASPGIIGTAAPTRSITADTTTEGIINRFFRGICIITKPGIPPRGNFFCHETNPRWGKSTTRGGYRLGFYIHRYPGGESTAGELLKLFQLVVHPQIQQVAFFLDSVA